jgi:hypothetical protein
MLFVARVGVQTTNDISKSLQKLANRCVRRRHGQKVILKTFQTVSLCATGWMIQIVWEAGFGFQRSGFRVQGSGFQGSGVRVQEVAGKAKMGTFFLT